MEALMEEARGVPQMESGFSLIEILVAVGIMAIAILGIMALLPQGYGQITKAGRLSTMNHLAEQKIDQLRTLPWSHSDLTAGSHPGTPEIYKIGPTPHTDFPDIYNVSWVVTDGTSGTNTANTKTVVITVGFDKYYDNGTAKASNLSLNAMTYDYQTMITP